MKDISFEIKVPSWMAKNTSNIKMFFSLAIVAVLIYFKDNVGMDLADALIAGYFLISILWKISSRISAGIALAFLVICAVANTAGYADLAKNSAIYAYYFLVITVVREIIDLVKEKERPVDNWALQKNKSIV